MKRIIALLLAIMMLSIFTLPSYAAMERHEFKEVLLGDGEVPEEIQDANLIRAYKNVSQDQLTAMRDYHNEYGIEDVILPEGLMASLPTTGSAVLTEDEVKTLLYGFVKLMTFTNAKNGTEANPNTWDNTIGNNDIERAVDVFYGDGSSTTPFAALDKIAGGQMTKNALGGLIFNMQTNLRAQAKDNLAFISTFQAQEATFRSNVKDMVRIALVDALNKANYTQPFAAELNRAKIAMLDRTHYLTGTATAVNDDSPFINLLLASFDAMEADTANNGDVVLSVVFNTIMSGVMDAGVDVYETATATTPLQTIEPNQTIDTIYEGDVRYLNITTGFTLGAAYEDPITLAVTSNLEGDSTNNVIEVAALESNKLKIVGKSAGTGIIKLYRNLMGSTFDNQMCNTAADEAEFLPELFMELNITVEDRPSTGGGKPAPTTPPKRVEAPAIEFEVDSSNNITVTLETNTSGATIYYTTDGSTPTENSQKYEGPFSVDNHTTIKTYATKPGWVDSYVTTDTIDLSAGRLPTLSSEHIAYVHGRDTGNFDADDYVTRAEVTAMFSRLVVKKMVFRDQSASKFPDVLETEWSTPYIKYLSNVDIVEGYEDGTFRPHNSITRAEFATIASRFYELEVGEDNNFTDVSDNHWAKEYIDSAVIKGWLIGYGDGTFRPDEPIRRSEAVTIVNRMLNRSADKAYIAEHFDAVLTYPDLDESHWAYYDILEASNWHDHKYMNNAEYWLNIFYLERFNAS